MNTVIPLIGVDCFQAHCIYPFLRKIPDGAATDLIVTAVPQDEGDVVILHLNTVVEEGLVRPSSRLLSRRDSPRAFHSNILLLRGPPISFVTDLNVNLALNY